MYLLFLLFTTSLAMSNSEYSSPSSYPSCFLEGSTWSSHESMEIHPNISSASSCQHLCLQTSSCSHFSWYNDQAVPLDELCFLFTNPTASYPCANCVSNLTASYPCANCVSGLKSCTCSLHFSCQFTGENLIAQFPNMGMEVLCQDICAGTHDCAFYSWFSEQTHPFPNSCFLFSSCLEKDFNCKNCLSGPPSCEDIAIISSTTSSSSSSTLTTITTSPSSSIASTTPSATTPMPCNFPDPAEHGDWFCPPHSSGAICHLECHPGYASNGKTIITCTDGLWSSSPTCVEAIGLITGNLDSPQNTVEVYSENKHEMLPSLPDGRTYHSLALTDSKILLCGGFKTDHSCLYLSLTLEWFPHSMTPSPHYKHASVSLLGQLHLLGGANSPSATEILSQETINSTWSKGPDLLEPANRACAVKTHPDMFVVTGGYNKIPSAAVVSYNASSGVATRLHDLNIFRYDHGCVYVRETRDVKGVLVAGGLYGQDTSELYSFATGQWVITGPLTVERKGVRLLTLGEQILAFGGYDRSALATVDKFNVTALEWLEAQEMLQPRSSHAVIGVPPNFVTVPHN